MAFRYTTTQAHNRLSRIHIGAATHPNGIKRFRSFCALVIPSGQLSIAQAEDAAVWSNGYQVIDIRDIPTSTEL